jgi:hypothetical protein
VEWTPNFTRAGWWNADGTPPKANARDTKPRGSINTLAMG